MSYSAEGERAIRALNRARALVAQLRREARLLSAPRRRAYQADINELGLVRGWSVLEAYLTSRADTLLQRDLPVPVVPSPLQMHVHAAVLDDFRSWRGIEEFWKHGLGSSGPHWQALPEYKELRNVIAHGLGYVRPRPGPKPFSAAMTRRLSTARLSPRSYAGRVPIVDSDLDKFLAIVADFIATCETSNP